MRIRGNKAHRARGLAKGFTLIEMIAVAAIIAVLAAILLPRWIKRIDLKVERAERSNLVTISNALVAQVARGTPLPDATTWRQRVSDWSMLPMSKVTANSRRYSRTYFLQSGSNPSAGYSQTYLGFQDPPQNLRAMVVSILGGDELDASNCPQPTGGALNATEFEEIWGLGNDSRPTNGLWANWKGQGDDFFVQRVNYTPVFHHLVLLNRETNDLPGFTINGLPATPQPIARIQGTHNTGWGAYYLEGTVVGLCNPAGQTMTRYVLHEDISFVWEKGKWRAEIMGAPDSSSVADDFSQKAKEFMEAARYGSATKATQQGVTTTMYDFMLAYVYWSEECPRFQTHGVSHMQVAEYRIIERLGVKNGLLDVFSMGLVNK